MPLTDEQKNAVAAAAIIAGGAGLGYAIYKVVAATKATQKPPPPAKGYRCTGPPNYACVESASGPYTSLAACLKACGPPGGKKYRCTGAPSFTCVEDPAGPYATLAACVNACPPSAGLPDKIVIQSYPQNLIQRLGFLRTSPPGSSLLACLYYVTLYGNDVTGHSQGYNTYHAYFQVQDDYGVPVPNWPILVWPLQTQDDQGGVLLINGSPRYASSPLLLKSDSQGIIHIWLEYHETDPTTLQILLGKHGMKCSAFLGIDYWIDVGNFTWGKCCDYAYLPLPVPTVPRYTITKNAATEVRSRIVHLEFQGAPAHYIEIVVGVQLQSICIW